MFITPAFAQTASTGAAASQGAAGLFNMFIPLVLVFGVVYLLILRPQSKAQKAHREKLAAVKKGDQVVTGGGLVGKVTRVDETYVDVELGPSMKVKAVKTMLSDVIDPLAGKPADR